MTISVIGHDWWWEVRYPQQHVVTANEIHIPTGTPVLLHLTTGDVIHSFWVPQSERENGHDPGVGPTGCSCKPIVSGIYRGQCAEFCGLEHARMSFLVIAEPPSQFQAWLAPRASPSGLWPEPPRGQRVFLNSTCVSCHAIQGTSADATDGPDLTHFGSRRTIAANWVPNTTGNLAAWIEDPQGIKPGDAPAPGGGRAAASKPSERLEDCVPVAANRT